MVKRWELGTWLMNVREDSETIFGYVTAGLADAAPAFTFESPLLQALCAFGVDLELDPTMGLADLEAGALIKIPCK